MNVQEYLQHRGSISEDAMLCEGGSTQDGTPVDPVMIFLTVTRFAHLEVHVQIVSSKEKL